jgi:hypothetical protein
LHCPPFSTGTVVAEYDLDDARHDYWHRPLTDRFTKLKAEMESGNVRLDGAGEKECLLSLLKALEYSGQFADAHLFHDEPSTEPHFTTQSARALISMRTFIWDSSRAGR